jgi:hypothetical protein
MTAQTDIHSGHNASTGRGGRQGKKQTFGCLFLQEVTAITCAIEAAEHTLRGLMSTMAVLRAKVEALEAKASEEDPS